MQKDVKTFDMAFAILIVLFFLLAALICYLPHLFITNEYLKIDFSKNFPIGDTYVGIMGPFIAILASFLTFIAFWVQYKANRRQNLQFDLQAKDVAIQRFESKFFELLKLHRNNVEDIDISNGGIVGRKAFISLYLELSCTYYALKNVIMELLQKHLIENIPPEIELVNIAYTTFFTGVGDNSDQVLQDFLGVADDDIILNAFIAHLKKSKHQFNATGHIQIQTDDKVIDFRSYMPFNGHMSILGHYYRHLFQTVKFVVTQDKKILNRSDKYQYLKTLRAQLSDHEQLLLYYNGLSTLGHDWINLKYFTNWKMIKNMPTALADFGLRPENVLGLTNDYEEKIFG